MENSMIRAGHRGLTGARVLLGLLLLAAVASAADTRTTLSGEFRQGAVVIGRTLPGSTVLQDGKPVRVGGGGDFLLGFDRDAPAVSALQIRYPGGEVLNREVRVAQREYQVQRIDGLPQRKVTPRSKADLARIRADGAAVRKARARDDDRQDFLRGFVWPAIGPISGVYGSQRVLNGKPRRPHYGVDVAAPVGTPVRAPAAGVVTLAHPDLFFSGGTLILDHGHKLSSSFLHLSKLHANVGDRVRQGDLIAEIGATGRVTGAHLDWRMNLRDRRVDPQLLVGPMPVAKRTAAAAGD